MIIYWCKSKGKAVYVIGTAIIAQPQTGFDPVKGPIQRMVPILHYAAVAGGEHLFGPAGDFIPMLTEEQKTELLNTTPPPETLEEALKGKEDSVSGETEPETTVEGGKPETPTSGYHPKEDDDGPQTA